MNHLNGMPDVPISSFWLLMLGAGLLLIAGVMLLFRKTGRVALERSLLTDEVTIYLSRIADAVERQARVPTVEEVVEMAQKRIAEQKEEAKEAPKSHAIAHSMFGREYQDSR